MAKKLSLLDSGWLMMETRETPMHVAGLQLFTLPEDAPADYLEQLYQRMLALPRPGRIRELLALGRLQPKVLQHWIIERVAKSGIL